jgi:hypothetical protein
MTVLVQGEAKGDRGGHALLAEAWKILKEL